MDKPACRLCAHKHYSYEPHVWTPNIPNTTPNIPNNVIPNKVVEAKQVSTGRSEAEVKEGLVSWKQANRERYNAYQREYMRKRRMKDEPTSSPVSPDSQQSSSS